MAATFLATVHELVSNVVACSSKPDALDSRLFFLYLLLWGTVLLAAPQLAAGQTDTLVTLHIDHLAKSYPLTVLDAVRCIALLTCTEVVAVLQTRARVTVLLPLLVLRVDVAVAVLALLLLAEILSAAHRAVLARADVAVVVECLPAVVHLPFVVTNL